MTLDTENVRAKRVETFQKGQKELYASAITCNLVAQFRRQAARIASSHVGRFGNRPGRHGFVAE